MTKKQQPTDTAAAPAGLPLFFKQPSVLDSTRHAKAGVKPADGNYSFARATNSLPLNVIEFLEVARHYPIVFTPGEQPIPMAVVGLEQENYFVSPEGKWDDQSYIPAYARQYPFVFYQHAEDGKFYLCIDEASPQFSAEAGAGTEPLYTADGKPTRLTENALQFCTAMQQHHTATQQFCADLAKHKLLMPYHSETKLKNGRTITLGGFMMLDEKAFNALPDDVFLIFRKQGWLPFIYLAMNATGNWRKLVDLAAEADKKKAA